jgi:hypothetical protein
MSRPRPTPAEAISVADDHLLYEIGMVAGLTQRLTRFAKLLESNLPLGSPVTEELLHLTGRNADIEAFTVHVRVLLDFLYDDKPRADDAVATDFFDDAGRWKTIRPSKTAALAEIKSRVGGEIAHLTYRRSAPAKEWVYETIWNDLSDVLRLFVDNAAQDRLSSHFRAEAGALLAQVVAVPASRFAALAGVTEAMDYTGAEGTGTTGGTAILPLPEPFPYGD